jgi:tetratricopeptide (TPR) repeat protein
VSEALKTQDRPDAAPAAVSTTDFASVRNLVFRRSSAAASRCAELKARLDSLSARLELLSALAEANEDEQRARSRVLAAVRAVRSLGFRDSETVMDVVFGLLVADRPVEAAAIALERFDAGASTIQPAAVFVVIDRLDEAGRRDEADELLASVLRRVLISAAPAPGPRQAAVSAVPSSRRWLPRLFDKAYDAVDHFRETGRERMADEVLGSVLQRIALGSASVDALTDAPVLDAIPAAQRRLLDELLSRTAARLDGDGNDVLRTLHAAALVTTGKPTEGVKLADEVLERDPDEQRARWVRIAALASLGDYTGALDDLEKLPDTAPSEQVTTLRVRLLTRAGRHKDALDVAGSVAETATGVTAIAIVRAEALAAAGRDADALEVLDEFLQEQPDKVDALTFRAELLHRSGRHDEAITELTKVVERDPMNTDAHAGLSRLYEDTGKGELALDECERALALAPGRPDLLVQRARILQAAGRLVEALESVDEAQLAGTGSSEVPALRGELLDALGRPDEALEAFLAAFRASPDWDAEKAAGYARSLELLASTLLNEGRSSDAILGTLEVLLDANQISGLGLGLRAELLRVDGQPQEALEQADAAVAAGADAEWMAGTKADCLLTLGRSADALAAIEPVVAANPYYLFGQSVRVQALDAVGRVTEALEVLDEHFVTDENWQVWAGSARGSLLIELGRLDEAVEKLEAALEESEGQPWWLVQVGVAYHRLGRVQDAVGALQRGADNVDEPSWWVLLELADARTHAEGSAPQAAREIYEAVASDGFVPDRPKSGLDAGWAHIRLQQLDKAVQDYESTFAVTEDAQLVDHFCLGVALALGGREPEADEVVERTLARVTELEDRERAGGVVAEARHLIALLQADSTWRSEAGRLAAIAGRI